MRDLKIAYGNSREATFWSNKTIQFDELCDRLKTPIRTSETAEEYPKLPKSERDEIKDKGGFVAGHLRDNRRKVEKVACRSMLVYDLDSIKEGELSGIVDRIPNCGCYYTTHSHTPKNPRARMIIPVTRDMSSDEFNAVARYYAADNRIIDTLDPCSFSPNQLMYWPTCPSNGEYLFERLDGDWLNPDDVLEMHPDWHDCSLLPTTPKESRAEKRSAKTQKDPLEKNGIVGAVCRTYTVPEIIERYLSEVYAPTADGSGRYDYIPGEGSAGVVIYDDKFAYSHHATDPAGGKLCNAFDLIRVHMFGDEEGKKAYSDTAAFFLDDDRVKETLYADKHKQADEDFSEKDDSDWVKELEYDKDGNASNSLHNIMIILKHDPRLQGIRYNAFTDNIDVEGDLPWGKKAAYWRDADDAQLVCYIDSNYGHIAQSNCILGLTKTADDRLYHPVRIYLESLPEWDGIPRVDTLLIDYLGADDSPYVRAVTRKTLCAAYDRVYEPGCKFDSMLVLNGPQGIGKSTLIMNLAPRWFSDSLSLSDMNDKTAAEKLQGYWIHEISELAGMKKAEIEKVKAFISRRDDKYRASYGKRSTPHPRQCVFFGTTNKDNGYLRDETGNRRFWNVKVTGKAKHKPWELTSDTADQVWAEVTVLANAGEELFLSAELESYACEEQREALEQDEREGIVAEYLDMLLPENWDSMDIYKRVEYVHDTADPTRPEGKVRRETVCNMEIWCECFGKKKEDMRPSDSYAISAIMARISSWKRTQERAALTIYGRQRLYKRIE